MKIALLGGNGFVGRNIAEVLTENNIDFAVASFSSGVDLRDKSHATTFLDQVQPDFIINCAAHVGSLNYVTEKAADVIADNCRMILGMYEAVAEVCPRAVVINPIANCAYPASANIFREEEWWNGHLHRSVLSYGASRRMLWAVGECFQMQHGLKSLHLLVPNMYGPHDSTDPNKAHALNALISKFVKAEKQAQDEVVIWGTGVAIREWLYAKDFGRIVLEILQNPSVLDGSHSPLNVAQNSGLSVKELVEIISSSFNFSGNIKWDTSKPDGAPKKVMDDENFRHVFPGFRFTPFETGIANTIKYYESVYPY
ncbi:NAD-dependent epimerase/dehydratase family protein [Rufibacter psychrotolerans]|uniref:NAD-dependent epimerase/dehydratase family protein n=1 Tax=Rufibacter psychrotolerans TaxID=2812556 RepID=UPI00196828E1|nr:NAD-dependent epimerase/dehydratase family protein [Rufibacter sp. SYSU D00308]